MLASAMVMFCAMTALAGVLSFELPADSVCTQNDFGCKENTKTSILNQDEIKGDYLLTKKQHIGRVALDLAPQPAPPGSDAVHEALPVSDAVEGDSSGQSLVPAPSVSDVIDEAPSVSDAVEEGKLGQSPASAAQDPEAVEEYTLATNCDEVATDIIERAANGWGNETVRYHVCKTGIETISAKNGSAQGPDTFEFNLKAIKAIITTLPKNDDVDLTVLETELRRENRGVRGCMRNVVVFCALLVDEALDKANQAHPRSLLQAASRRANGTKQSHQLRHSFRYSHQSALQGLVSSLVNKWGDSECERWVNEDIQGKNCLSKTECVKCRAPNYLENCRAKCKSTNLWGDGNCNRWVDESKGRCTENPYQLNCAAKCSAIWGHSNCEHWVNGDRTRCYGPNYGQNCAAKCADVMRAVWGLENCKRWVNEKPDRCASSNYKENCAEMCIAYIPNNPPAVPQGWFWDNMLVASCCDKKAYTQEVGVEASAVITQSGGFVHGFGYHSGGAGHSCKAKQQIYYSRCMGVGIDVGGDAYVAQGYYGSFDKIAGWSTVVASDAAFGIGFGFGVVMGGKNGEDGNIGVVFSAHVGAGVDISMTQCYATPIGPLHEATVNCHDDATNIGKWTGRVVGTVLGVGHHNGGAVGAGLGAEAGKAWDHMFGR